MKTPYETLIQQSNLISKYKLDSTDLEKYKGGTKYWTNMEKFHVVIIDGDCMHGRWWFCAREQWWQLKEQWWLCEWATMVVWGVVLVVREQRWWLEEPLWLHEGAVPVAQRAVVVALGSGNTDGSKGGCKTKKKENEEKMAVGEKREKEEEGWKLWRL